MRFLKRNVEYYLRIIKLISTALDTLQGYYSTI